jgi:hypothetical protein
MALTDEQVYKALKWVTKRAREDGANFQDVASVVIWMIKNPLPDRAIWEAEADTQEEEERTARIEHLNAELTKLDAPTRETS